LSWLHRRINGWVGGTLMLVHWQEPEEFIKWGRTLRKHNVAVDIISFGESTKVNSVFLQVIHPQPYTSGVKQEAESVSESHTTKQRL
jgi:hypothetical protein